MKVTFVSNFLSTHQIPFSFAMRELLGVGYVFVESFLQEKGSYKLSGKEYPFVLKAYDGKESFRKAEQLVLGSNVVIFGSGDYRLIRRRIKHNKITFFYSERIFKSHAPTIKDYVLRGIQKKIVYPWAGRNNYLLCASAYAAYDFEYCGLFPNRMYKWGYFTSKQANRQIKQSSSIPRLLWAGRMLGWKNAWLEECLAKQLLNENINFKMIIIGDGEKYAELEKRIIKDGLGDWVEMTGSLSHKEVLAHMVNSDIFCFTSNHNEGWGMVLNEAMQAGCACVASRVTGSTPFLIKDGENGLIFENENLRDFVKKVKQLILDVDLRQHLQAAAVETIENEWNANVAAKRFIDLVEDINNRGESMRFVDGPCSRAEILKDDR